MKIIKKILIDTFISMFVVYIVMSFGNASLNIKEWSLFSISFAAGYIYFTIIFSVVSHIYKNK